jgi:hypothetical protein
VSVELSTNLAAREISLTPESRQEYAKNWTMVLDGLKKAVEGSLPRSSAETSAQQQRT